MKSFPALLISIHKASPFIATECTVMTGNQARGCSTAVENVSSVIWGMKIRWLNGEYESRKHASRWGRSGSHCAGAEASQRWLLSTRCLDCHTCVISCTLMASYYFKDFCTASWTKNLTRQKLNKWNILLQLFFKNVCIVSALKLFK